MFAYGSRHWRAIFSLPALNGSVLLHERDQRRDRQHIVRAGRGLAKGETVRETIRDATAGRIYVHVSVAVATRMGGRGLLDCLFLEFR